MKYTANENRYEKMVYNKCGDSGLKLPAVSLGLWHNFGTKAKSDTMKEMLFTAFDLGITHFDLANNYGPIPGSAEENFGKILHSDMMQYRDEMIISTKAGYDMWAGPYGNFGSKKYLIASLNQSLKRMNLDYVDIFYHHRMDPDTPLEETMHALDCIVKSGKALYVGLSNYDGQTMIKASKILENLGCPFVINQNAYSILNRTVEHNGLKGATIEKKKGLIVFSPLAQGLLSNRYLKDIPEDSRIKTDGRFLTESDLTEDMRSKLQTLNTIAKNRGQTLAQMALSYMAQDDAVTSVLIGASKPEQIKENVACIEKLNFTIDELVAINAIAG